jgi:phosphate/sulfate permease
MSRTQRWLIMGGVLVIAALLAFPLRTTIYETVVIPLAFVAWEAGLLYRSLSQVIWWWLIIAIVLFMLAFSLLPQFKPSRKDEKKSKPKHGQVEELAIWLGRAKSGVYFKWLIANRLGKLAYQILVHREAGRPRSVFAPLVGLDWKPSRELQKYLETGLHGSFSDFPTPRRTLVAPPKTPLDYEVSQAVEFLETQVENSKSA